MDVVALNSQDLQAGQAVQAVMASMAVSGYLKLNDVHIKILTRLQISINSSTLITLKRCHRKEGAEHKRKNGTYSTVC
jgi:hypothetical protein